MSCLIDATWQKMAIGTIKVGSQLNGQYSKAKSVISSPNTCIEVGADKKAMAIIFINSSSEKIFHSNK